MIPIALSCTTLDSRHEDLLFWAALRFRVAVNRRPLIRRKPTPNWVPYSALLSIKNGIAGTTNSCDFSPTCLFQGKKIYAFDTSNMDGTHIEQIYVGSATQLPPGGQPTTAFSSTTHGTPIMMTATYMKLTITVKFLDNCDFYATVFGRAAL